jgi:hypothetical protein
MNNGLLSKHARFPARPHLAMVEITRLFNLFTRIKQEAPDITCGGPGGVDSTRSAPAGTSEPDSHEQISKYGCPTMEINLDRPRRLHGSRLNNALDLGMSDVYSRAAFLCRLSGGAQWLAAGDASEIE